METNNSKYINYRLFLKNSRKAYRPWFTYIYFPITYPLSYALYRAGFSANAVSVLGITTSLVGGYLIFKSQVLFGLLVLLVSYLFDFCDGNVARFRYGYLKEERNSNSAKLGSLLENLYANISYFLLFIPVGFYLTTVSGDIIYFLVAVFGYQMKLLSRYTVIHVCLLNKKGYDTSNKREENNNPLFRARQVNDIKYFFTSVIDNARVYFISFIVVWVLFPSFFPIFFVYYMAYIFLVNLTKLILTLVRRLP